jgi:hypothetical protein
MLQAAQLRAAQDCEKKNAARDDAQLAVHKYDEAITRYEASLQIEKGQLAMAKTSHDKFRIAAKPRVVQLFVGKICLRPKLQTSPNCLRSQGSPLRDPGDRANRTNCAS